ncbi:MAG TPA: hypothetical protein VIU61_12555 [Kofleriaceae bacterium]
MSGELSDVHNPVIDISPTVDDGGISVRFAGTADVEAKSDLDDFMKKLHTESLRLGVARVALDFRELAFMNSSCFKIFVAWLAQIRDLSPDKQYRIQLYSNPNLLWQRRSLAALSCFASNLVTIEA